VSTDTLTFLGTLGSIVAAKRIRLRDGQPPEIIGYDDAKHFTVVERPVASIDDAAELLAKVERQPHYMMIRGRPLPDIDRDHALRRKLNGRDDGSACFEAAPHHVIPLDLDSVECPEGCDPLDPETAVKIVAARLPSEFYGVTCWWQFTSSAGLKAGIRLRLFFWGSRPTTDAELKAWLPKSIVDHAIFDPVQPIYVANPIFEEGADPVPVRSGLLRGQRDVVEVPDEIEADAGGHPALGYAGWRAVIGDHLGGKGFNAPIKAAIAAWIGKHGAEHPTTWLRADIEKAIREADASNHAADYIAKKIADLDRLIAWTLEQEALKPPKQSQAAAAAAIADDGAVFRTLAGDAFVDFDVNGHRETHAVRSKAFKEWLSLRFYRSQGKPLSGEALDQALVLAESRSRYDAPVREVFVRVARVDDKLYIDMADPGWRAIEVDAAGWRIVKEPPVRFRRPAGQLPLPEPARGGSVDALRAFINVDDQGFVLVVAWLLAALGGAGPYPVLAITGEHGAAKTSTGKICRRIVDPDKVLSNGPPRSERDLYITAHNSHCLYIENISKIPEWLSDTLCRLSTGGGFKTRLLYADDQEKVFDGMRPLIVDGIEKFVERADLADRSIKVTLLKVPGKERRAESELKIAFDAAHPGILGALLDVVAHGLRELPHTKLEELPRMADFALWTAACEGALWEKGTFRKIYDENRDEMLIDTIADDPLANAIRKLVREDLFGEPFWRGTATELLQKLEQGLEDLRITFRPDWPKNGRYLSGRLRRMKDSLSKVGIDVMQQETHNREITLAPRW
jgi:hypothetical protein